MSVGSTSPGKETWIGSDMHAFRICSWAGNNMWRAGYSHGNNSVPRHIKLNFADMEVIIYPGDTLVFDGSIFYVD